MLAILIQDLYRVYGGGEKCYHPTQNVPVPDAK